MSNTNSTLETRSGKNRVADFDPYLWIGDLCEFTALTEKVGEKKKEIMVFLNRNAFQVHELTVVESAPGDL